MFVADHNSAVRRNFKSRAMPEKEIPPARLVDIYLKGREEKAKRNRLQRKRREKEGKKEKNQLTLRIEIG